MPRRPGPHPLNNLSHVNTRHIIPMTLPSPSGSWFYSGCKVGIVALARVCLQTDGEVPGRDVKHILGGPVRLALSAAGRGHRSLRRTGGPLQV